MIQGLFFPMGKFGFFATLIPSAEGTGTKSGKLLKGSPGQSYPLSNIGSYKTGSDMQLQ